MTKRALLALLCAMMAALPALSQQGPFSVQAVVDWKGGTEGVSVSRALDPTIPALPRAEADAEASIDTAFIGLFLDAVFPIVVESSHTVGNLLGSDPLYFSWIEELGRRTMKNGLSLSPDFTRVVATYAFPLFSDHGIATFLYPRQDMPIRRRLGYVSTRAFSGIVIYAMDKLPAVGLNQEQYLAPALFPRIFDEEMNLVLDRSMCRPAALSKWGMVGYADSLDENEYLARIGQHPLRIAARGVFGAHPTDIVISTDAARQILSLPDNIELLKEGKIIVIYQSLK